MLGMYYSSGLDGPEPLPSVELCWDEAGQTAVSDRHVRTKECQSGKVTAESQLLRRLRQEEGVDMVQGQLEMLWRERSAVC